MRKAKLCKRCGTPEACGFYVSSDGICEDCERPHDHAPRPRSKKYKPNTRLQKLRHRFPDEYWQLGGIGVVFHLRDESMRYTRTAFRISRQEGIKQLIRAAGQDLQHNDLPF